MSRVVWRKPLVQARIGYITIVIGIGLQGQLVGQSFAESVVRLEIESLLQTSLRHQLDCVEGGMAAVAHYIEIRYLRIVAEKSGGQSSLRHQTAPDVGGLRSRVQIIGQRGRLSLSDQVVLRARNQPEQSRQVAQALAGVRVPVGGEVRLGNAESVEKAIAGHVDLVQVHTAPHSDRMVADIRSVELPPAIFPLQTEIPKMNVWGAQILVRYIGIPLPNIGQRSEHGGCG